MSLKEKLATLRLALESDLPSGALTRLRLQAAAFEQPGRRQVALRAGNSAPDFELPDDLGSIVGLHKLLQRGPVVLCFYWGDWCGFCRLELAALAEVASEVERLGTTMVAIAPQPAHDRRITTADVSFPLLVDTGAAVAKLFGIALTPDSEMDETYAALGRPACENSATDLPIPAVYIVDGSGTIVFSYLDSDFTNRIEPSDILAGLRRLQQGGGKTSVPSLHAKPT